jgi:hypothetical protein
LESITQGVETDLSAREVLGLIRMQLKDMSEWEITMLSMDGESAYKTTYTYSDSTVYVMLPYQDSITEIQHAVKDVMDQ